MRTIINWSGGGLGNRLKPMGSCAMMARKTDRTLGMVWKPALRCLAPFDSLFLNFIPQFNISIFDPAMGTGGFLITSLRYHIV